MGRKTFIILCSQILTKPSMTQKKPSFRFRIPWLMGMSESSSRRLKDTSKSTTQSDTNVPVQRPYMPSLIIPAEPPLTLSPTKAQEATRSEPQNQSPPHPTPLSSSVVVETTHSKPSSPSTSPKHVNSPPSSSADESTHHTTSSSSEQEKEKLVNKSEPIPQETEVESELKVKANSPLREITKLPKENIWQTSSTSEEEKEKMSVSNLMPNEVEPKMKSPLKSNPMSRPENLFKHTTTNLDEERSISLEENTWQTSSTSQEEKEKMSMSNPMSNEAEPKIKSPLKINPMLQPENLFKHTTTNLDEERSISPEENTWQTSSTSQEEKEKMPMSNPMPYEAEPKMKSPLKINSMSRSENLFKHTTKNLDEEKSISPKENAWQTSSTTQEEKEKMSMSNPMPYEVEPKMKSPLKINPMSRLENLFKHTTTNLDEEGSISTKPKSPPLETQIKFREHEEKLKVMHETKKVGKDKDTSTSRPTRHTKASTSGTKDKKKHGVRETVERKIMFATSNSSRSHQRTVPSMDEREKGNKNEKGPLQKGIKDDITKFVGKISASVNPTHPMEDKQFSVITLTGDNRGATMHVGSESGKKEGSIHIHRDYKTDPDEESNEVTTDGEGNTNTEDEEEEEDSMEHGEVGNAYVNSNIQSINNSLMFHGSINERDPGVQVTLPQKSLESIKRDDKDTHNNRRTEFNISRSQKSTFQPTVRRRCFRGNDIEDIEIL
ncbi:uncharacterized protein [Cicer arietinum]|uniref:Proteoglycan 4-like n=1 Tax=Cicer arietinum TaxID=3827 RepID=A0A1S2Y4F3_CICAR|nr:proteoglycan 4-like [Cicer arietinum]